MLARHMTTCLEGREVGDTLVRAPPVPVAGIGPAAASVTLSGGAAGTSRGDDGMSSSCVSSDESALRSLTRDAPALAASSSELSVVCSGEAGEARCLPPFSASELCGRVGDAGGSRERTDGAVGDRVARSPGELAPDTCNSKPLTRRVEVGTMVILCGLSAGARAKGRHLAEKPRAGLTSLTRMSELAHTCTQTFAFGRLSCMWVKHM